MFGALPAGILADYLGRKWAMLSNNILAVVGVALQAAAVHPYMFIAGRIVIGVNAGTAISHIYATHFDENDTKPCILSRVYNNHIYS